ncbi:Tc toxin subunit A, partial [Kibdelosporangium lantanae]
MSKGGRGAGPVACDCGGVRLAERDGLPRYERLFGDLDFRVGDEARTVYSPAAYLADLLQLLDDNFVDASLFQRRPDISDIPLDSADTDGTVPYLDIVNEVLERLIGERPYEQLRNARYPFMMPFSLWNERWRRYLAHSEVSAADFYRQFSVIVDYDVVAREFLGLSVEEVASLTTAPLDESQVKACYQIGPDDSFDALRDVARFLRVTGLSRVELRELLYQNLTVVTSEVTGASVCPAASAFFVNQGGGCASL